MGKSFFIITNQMWQYTYIAACWYHVYSFTGVLKVHTEFSTPWSLSPLKGNDMLKKEW